MVKTGLVFIVLENVGLCADPMRRDELVGVDHGRTNGVASVTSVKCVTCMSYLDSNMLMRNPNIHENISGLESESIHLQFNTLDGQNRDEVWNPAVTF